MSLLTFMTVAKPSAADVPRSPHRLQAKSSSEATADPRPFDATFKEARRQKRTPDETAKSEIPKLDNPSAKRHEKTRPESDAKQDSTPDTPPASDVPTQDSNDGDPKLSKESDHASGDQAADHPAETSTDGINVVVAANQDPTAGAPQAAPAPIAATAIQGSTQDAPDKCATSQKATTDQNLPADKSPPRTAAAGKSDGAPEQAVQAPEQTDSAPQLPASAARESKSHEKQTHAAHQNAAAPESAVKQTAPLNAQTPADPSLDPSLAQALAAAPENLAAQTLSKPDAAPGSADPSQLPGIVQGGGGSVRGADVSAAELAPVAQDSPRSEGSDTFDQVVMGLKGKLDARTGKAEIRLDPPNLGTVRVSVTLNDGQLTAEFQSASTLVRDLLKDNLDKLKTALQGQGVTVDRLAVDAPPALSAPAGAGQNAQSSFGSATHDGRSAGQFQDGRSGQQRSAGEGFARKFAQALEAPLDLVA